MSSSNTTTVNPQMPSDTTNESFPLGQTSDEVAPSLTAGRDGSSESRDLTPTITSSDAQTQLEPSNAVIEPQKPTDRPQGANAPPQAMLIFVMGDHCVSDSCELGVLNEHPEALETTTSNRCLSTSAFLKPALDAAMAELRPSMMVPIAVRLTAISLRLVAGILQNREPSPQREDAGGDEQQELAEFVRHKLGQAVPYYQWQGPRNYCGRIQYLMALREEAIRVMAVPTSSLAEALRLDVQAAGASRRLAQSISSIEQSLEEVCGVRASSLLQSMWASQKVDQPPQRPEPEYRKVNANGIEQMDVPDSESEDELPSPSEFVPRKTDNKAPPTSSQAQMRISKAVENESAKPGCAGRLSWSHTSSHKR